MQSQCGGYHFRYYTQQAALLCHFYICVCIYGIDHVFFCFTGVFMEWMKLEHPSYFG